MDKVQEEPGVPVTVLSDVKIAALVWMSRNRQRTVECGIDQLDIRSPLFEAEFLRLADMDKGTLRHISESRRGYRPRHFVDHDLQLIGSDFRPNVFYGLRKGWNALSRTVDAGPEEEVKRYRRGLSPTGTNCALNVAFVLGIHMRLGRIARDVMTPRSFRELDDPARAFWWILQGPLGRIAQTDLNRSGRILEEQLTHFDPAKFKHGSFQGVQGVIDALFTGAPQVTWTETRTDRCCDGILTLSKGRMEKRCSSITVGRELGKTLGQCVQKYFAKGGAMTATGRCTQRRQCTRTIFRQSHVVLDGSNPARLIVHLREPCMSNEDGTAFECPGSIFDDFDLTTTGIDRVMQTRYTVIAVVYLVHTNHFTLGVRTRGLRGDAGKVYFDDGVYTPMGEWWSVGESVTSSREVPVSRSKRSTARPRPLSVVTLVFEVGVNGPDGQAQQLPSYG